MQAKRCPGREVTPGASVFPCFFQGRGREKRQWDENVSAARGGLRVPRFRPFSSDSRPLGASFNVGHPTHLLYTGCDSHCFPPLSRATLPSERLPPPTPGCANAWGSCGLGHFSPWRTRLSSDSFRWRPGCLLRASARPFRGRLGGVRGAPPGLLQPPSWGALRPSSGPPRGLPGASRGPPPPGNLPVGLLGAFWGPPEFL